MAEKPTDQEVLKALVEADEEGFAAGEDVRQRAGWNTITRAMRRLGYESYVMGGLGSPPEFARLDRLVKQFYQPEDWQVGGVHMGAVTFAVASDSIGQKRFTRPTSQCILFVLILIAGAIMRTEAKPQKTVGIWIRVSTEDQVRGESPEHHEERARAYAMLKGWNVAQVYRLDAVSGKAVMGHSEAKRMLADIRSGVITGLVFSKIARLARNTKELLEFAEIFRACDADMISLAESIDTSTPAGRLFFTVVAAMAQWEREEIADRVRASVPIRAKLGKPTGGRAPFGYRWVDKKLVVHPEEAPVRALVYELFAEHRRKKTVARLLNERGYRTRDGKPFSDVAVTRLLEDPTAKGLHRANYTQGRDRPSHTALKPEEEWVWNEVEPIVSEELWEECAALLKSRVRGKRPAKRTTYLFSGIATCECGSKMYVPAPRTKYVCAKCRMKIPLDDLEALYRSTIAGFEFSPDEIAAHRQAANEALREKQALIDTAEAELKRLTQNEDELFDLYHAGALTKLDFSRRHRPISERRAQLEDELPRLQADRDVLKIGLVSEEVVLSETNDLNARWDQLSFEQRRELVERITDEFIVRREGVDIVIQESPFGNAAQMATNGRRFSRPGARCLGPQGQRSFPTKKPGSPLSRG